MTKVLVDNLYIFNTLNCNFKCAHCMRGEAQNINIKKSVLNELFDNICIVSDLKIGGGEPLLYKQGLIDILNIIEKKGVLLYSLSITTNGTLFTKEIENILKQYLEYIEYCNQDAKDRPKQINDMVQLTLSTDEYHEAFLKMLELRNPKLAKQYYENIKRLYNSDFFKSYRQLSALWNCGKAENLTEARKKLLNYQSFYYFDKENDVIFTGPVLSIFPNGMLTEMNGSLEDMQTKFNYENILQTRLYELIQSHLFKCHSLDDLIDKVETELETTNKNMAFVEEHNHKKLYLS